MGGGDVEVTIKPSTTTVTSENTVDILGLDNISLNADLKSDSAIDMGLDDINLKTELVLPQPFKTESDIRTELDHTSNVGLDIKPMTVDLCLKLDFDLPEKCIRQPYNHHFGITLFGVEVLGFNFAGESRIILEDLPNRPQVAWGGEQAVTHAAGHHGAARPNPADSLHIRLG